MLFFRRRTVFAMASIPIRIFANSVALRNSFLVHYSSSSAATLGNATFSTSRRHLPGRRGPGSKSGGSRKQADGGGSAEKTPKQFEELIVPVAVNAKDQRKAGGSENVGAELVGELSREKILDVLNRFPRRPNIRKLCEERGLSDRLFHQAFLSFRQFCLASVASLPADLHVTISDIYRSIKSVDDLLPQFLRHAKKVYPHLDCMDDLKQISDLRLPHNWYTEARSIQRKIIFHAGPTNSGKTYSALERFMNSKSGVYCGPLKLLASEVFHKTNNAGVPCDLITGEERRCVSKDGEISAHVSCTVEMLSTSLPYEVAVIDEIQMLRDRQRGWAWTRALLGIFAEEVHLCGEAAAIDLVRELLYPVGEEVEVRNYKRMTPLKVLDEAVGKIENVKPGDCIVAFSKNDIFSISRQLEAKNVQVAVVYGGLPPGTKLAQAQLFNDPNSSCKVMVSTDAIGMGLNLSIKRIIFYSLVKPTFTERGEKEMELLSTSQALQIAGRAGRYGTAFEAGEATTFRSGDLPKLKNILEKSVTDIEQAGLHPTVEQIEMFAYFLPNATLSNLIDIFTNICNVDQSKFFLCHMEDFKFLADMIQHVNLPLRTRYLFCMAPINRKQPFVCSMFLRFSRQFSRGEPLTWEWLCGGLGWPFSPPETIVDLIHLEGIFDVMDMYLWLGYRFVDMFPDMALVRDMQAELDCIIQEGVRNITKLLKNTESSTSSGLVGVDPDFQDFTRKRKTDAFLRTASNGVGVGGVPKSPKVDGQDSMDMKKDVFGGDSSKEEKLRVGHGMLTRRLIDQGLLTPEMVEQLKQEFLGGRAKKTDNDNDNDS